MVVLSVWLHFNNNESSTTKARAILMILVKKFGDHIPPNVAAFREVFLLFQNTVTLLRNMKKSFWRIEKVRILIFHYARLSISETPRFKYVFLWGNISSNLLLSNNKIESNSTKVPDFPFILDCSSQRNFFLFFVNQSRICLNYSEHEHKAE